MPKKLSILMFCLLAIILLIGCSGGTYKITSGNIGSTDNKISGKYNSFSGNYFKKEKFNKGQTINFNFSVSTLKGELSAKVIDSTGKTVVELKNDKSIKIDKTDTYKIEVEGEKHQGEFILTWQEKL